MPANRMRHVATAIAPVPHCPIARSSRALALALTALCLAAPVHAAPLARLILIISIDGLRPDAISKTSTPHLDALCRDGAHTWEAQTVTPSITLVSHTSMLTGVTPKRHGITTDTGRGTVGVVTCFQLAKRAGYLTSMIVGKPRLKRIAKGGTVDHFSVAGFWARDVAGEAVKRLDAQRNGLMFLHFPDPDSLGHQRGWMSKQQLKSVSDCDSAVGKVLAALSQRGLRGSTLTIVTADHGGHGRIHGTADPRDMTIPWIVCGPGIRNGHSLRSPITTCDTAATALYALGVQVPDGWKGKPVLEAFSGQEVGAGASFEMPNAPAKRRIQQP